MNYYREITFLPPTEALTDFPVLVRIRNDRMKTRILSPEGWDVRFELEGEELPFELDWFDASSGSGAWWVRIPTLSDSEPTTIKMLYGDETITSDQSDPATVWADYDYVYHFSGSDPFRDVRSGKTATTTASTATEPGTTATFSLVNEMPTGQALRVTPTENCSLAFAEYLNFNTGSVSFIGRASQRYEMKWMSDYYSYGFSGYESQYKIYGAGKSFNPTMTFPSFICYSASLGYGASDSGNSGDSGSGTSDSGDSGSAASDSGTSGVAVADLIFNGVAFDCSTAERQEWLRDDAPVIEFRPSCVSYLEELRISRTVKKSPAWMKYEQAQIVRHEEFTSYSVEFDSNDNPLPRFFPWIVQSASELLN